MRLEAAFTLERETKNTYRYQEELSGSGKPPIIGTLYVQKWAVGSPPQGGSGSSWRRREAAKLRLELAVGFWLLAVGY